MSALQMLPSFLLGFGILLDALSLIALVSTIVRRRWTSGFPFVGGACYVLFMLASLIPPLQGRLTSAQVLFVGATLLILHVVMHWAHSRMQRTLQGPT
jgi:hypothetical protein